MHASQADLVKKFTLKDLMPTQRGTTIHGVQNSRAGEEHEPLSYLHRNGPFGRAFVIIARRPALVATIGVVGRGTGALGCYARSNETWTFYEIDPMVERFARTDRWLKFMSSCGNHLALPAIAARIASETGMPMRHLHVPAGDDILRQRPAVISTRLQPMFGMK